MKQIFRTVAVIALAAVSASCAKERLAAPSGGETTVSFTVSAPVFQTRSIADGKTVDKVACCVYNSEGTYVAGPTETPVSKTIDISGGSATFTARLVTGQTYSFIFWAYKSNGGTEDSSDYYTFSAEDKTVTVKNYTGESNDESSDAFYAYVAPKQITGAFTQEVKLCRPFAQLNFGVEKDDITAAAAAGITVTKSKVTLTGLANVLNLVDGTVSGEMTAEFSLAACPTEDLEVKTTDGSGSEVTKKYGYVAMNYILVGKDIKTLTDAKLTVAKEDGTEINTLDVTAVPLQGNYRTNVLGNLFTSQVITNINVVPAFIEPDYEKEIWGGQVNTPSIDASGNYLITKPSELAWVAQQNNAGTTSFKQKTILLQNDIDLCNGFWTPIGTKAHPFQGVFDGNGKKITNLNVYSTTADDNLGLFGYLVGTSTTANATIKNVTIDNAQVISDVGDNTSGATCGVAAGHMHSYTSIDGVTVKSAVVTSNHYVGGICGKGYVNIKNCTVEGPATLTALPVYYEGAETSSTMCPNHDFGDKVGGIIGHLCEGWFTISGCTVANTSITGYRDLGGISGIALNSGGTPTFTNNTIGDNVTITVDATYNYKDYVKKSSFNAKSIVGRVAEGLTIGETNTGTATITYPGDITVD